MNYISANSSQITDGHLILGNKKGVGSCPEFVQMSRFWNGFGHNLALVSWLWLRLSRSILTVWCPSFRVHASPGCLTRWWETHTYPMCFYNCLLFVHYLPAICPLFAHYLFTNCQLCQLLSIVRPHFVSKVVDYLTSICPMSFFVFQCWKTSHG